MSAGNISDILQEYTTGKSSHIFIACLVLVQLFFLIVYKKVANRLLDRRRFIPYILLRPLYMGGCFWMWAVVLLGIGLNSIETYQGDACQFLVTKKELFELFLVFFFFFLAGTVKYFMLQEQIFKKKIKPDTIRRIVFVFYFCLFLWLLFLVSRFISKECREEGSWVDFGKDILTIGTMWSVLVMVLYGLRILSNYYTKKLEQLHYRLSVVVIRSLFWPVGLMLVGSMLIYTIWSFIALTTESKQYYIGVVLLSLFFWFFRATSLLEKAFLARKGGKGAPNRTMIQGVGNFVRALLILVSLILFFTLLLGKDLSAISTTLGGAGFGLAFAAKPIIENYFGGLMISFEGNFMVGDWIYFTDKKIEGIIEYIGQRSTSLRTFDKRLLYVPNAWFSSMSIVNASKMTHRRILQKIPIGWITSLAVLDKIIQEIRMVVYNHPGIDKTQALMVHFTGFGTQGLEITIYALTKTKNWHTYLNVQENILREAKRIIETHGGPPPMEIINYTPPINASGTYPYPH